MRSVARLTVWIQPLWLAAMMAFGAWISIQSGLDTNWDLANYHFYNGYAFLNDRLDVDIAVCQIQTYFNPALDTLTYLLIRSLRPVEYGLVMGALHGINLYLLFLIAHRTLSIRRPFWRVIAAAALSLGGALGIVFLAEIGTCFHDLIVSLFILSALFILIRPDTFSPGGRTAQALLASGMFLGIATGLKLTTALYSFAALLSLAFTIPGLRGRIRTLLWTGSGAFIGFLISYGHWAISLWKRFRNPFFPNFNALFRSSFFEPVNITDDRFLVRSLASALEFPIRVLSCGWQFGEMRLRDYRPAVLITLTIIAGSIILIKLPGRRTDTPDRIATFRSDLFLILFVLIGYAVWIRLFGVYRYLAVIDILFPVTILILLRCALRSDRIAVILAVAACWGGLWFEDVPSWGRTAWGDDSMCIDLSAIDTTLPTQVLVGSHQPVSYLIPYFPSHFEFLRLQSNFHDLDVPNTDLDRVIESRIRHWNSDRLLLIPSGHDHESDGILFRLGLKRVDHPLEIVNCFCYPPIHLYRLESIGDAARDQGRPRHQFRKTEGESR